MSDKQTMNESSEKRFFITDLINPITIDTKLYIKDYGNDSNAVSSHHQEIAPAAIESLAIRAAANATGYSVEWVTETIKAAQDDEFSVMAGSIRDKARIAYNAVMWALGEVGK